MLVFSLLLSVLVAPCPCNGSKEGTPIMLVVSDWIMESVLRFLTFAYIPGNYRLLKPYAKYTPWLQSFFLNGRLTVNFDSLKIYAVA